METYLTKRKKPVGELRPASHGTPPIGEPHWDLGKPCMSCYWCAYDEEDEDEDIEYYCYITPDDWAEAPTSIKLVDSDTVAAELDICPSMIPALYEIGLDTLLGKVKTTHVN